jgi:hypothetical protein
MNLKKKKSVTSVQVTARSIRIFGKIGERALIKLDPKSSVMAKCGAMSLTI